MSPFWLVIKALEESHGGETFIFTREDSFHAYEYENHFIIYPHYSWWNPGEVIPGGRLVAPEFEYSSGTNSEWLSVGQLREKLKTEMPDQDVDDVIHAVKKIVENYRR